MEALSLLAPDFLKNNYAFSQDGYLNTLPQIEPEHNGNYFWIFRNQDYIHWSQPNSYKERINSIATLVFSGSQTVEAASSHIVQNLPKTGTMGLLLCFFYRSARGYSGPSDDSLSNYPEEPVAGKNLVLICTLLQQLIRIEPSREQFLLRSFLRDVLAQTGNQQLKIVSESARNPKDSLNILLRISSPIILWAGFEAALRDVMERSPDADSKMSQNKQRMTFVFDLNDYPAQDAIDLITKLRNIKNRLEHLYRIRILLTCRSVTVGLGLRGPSEVQVEYEKERQGLRGC